MEGVSHEDLLMAIQAQVRTFFPEIHIVLNLVVCLQALNLSAGVFAALKTVVQPLACGAIFPAAKQTVLWFVAVLRPAS